jgi:hypothetical protein
VCGLRIASILLVSLVLLCRPAEAQISQSIVQFLDYALRVALGRLVEKGIDAIWSTGNEEVREIKLELARLRRAIENLPIGTKAKRPHCSEREPQRYLRCLVDLIRRARADGRIDDLQADELARMLLDALATERRAFPNPGLEAGPAPRQASAGDRIESRAIGPDAYCTRMTHPQGRTRVGIIRNGGRDGEWIELTSRLDAASITVLRDGRIESHRSLARRPLRPDRKREYARRVMYARLGTNQLAHGKGVTVYYGRRDPERVTMYFGTYSEGRRHGPGCYFGSLSVFPYCYRRDLRMRVPDRRGRPDLALCR